MPRSTARAGAHGTSPSARRKAPFTAALAAAVLLAAGGSASAAAGKAVYVGGAGGVFYRNMVVVLTWHDVEPKGVYDTISASAFAAQMHALRADRFHPITPALFQRFLAGRAAVPPNAVLLTFDNGTLGVYRYAFPVLRRYRFPILLFPIFGRTGVHSDFLTAAELRTLVASGLVTLGSHTYQEHNGIAVGPGESQPADVGREWNGHSVETLAHYEARILHDAALAQAAIRRYMGRPEPFFSDPFGQYTPLLLHLLAQRGFTVDFTTYGWAVVPGAPADRVPRINVGTGASTAASMVGAILTVASDAARSPGVHPPPSWVVTWH
ncbi:MAG: polysaccharide deacetylase family protein [Firmicutes bacterium]|nr:polysaccharide deacetylase family protein [Bacillota bacterium]